MNPEDGRPRFDSALRESWEISATDELAGFGGVDVRALLTRHDESQPLDIGWNAGVGARATR